MKSDSKVTHFDCGCIGIQQRSAGSRAIVFIPGMAAGASAWDEIAPDFVTSHAVYAVTLPGYDGRPAVTQPVMERVAADLACFVADLNRPILVGHSQGGFLGFKIAAEHPDLISGVVAVDGFPVFPSLAAASAEERRALADRYANLLARNKTAMEFGEAIRNFILARAHDQTKAEAFAQRAANSDPAATEHYIVEMLTSDLRPQLSAINVPVLALVADDSYMAGMKESEMRTFYADMLRDIEASDIDIMVGCRHFVTLDEPARVSASIKQFLQKIGR